MRTIYAILGISLLLFLGSIGFAAYGVRQTRGEPAAAPVATVRQMMDGLLNPAATTIYNAVSTTVTEQGVQDVRPADDREWERVAGNAMMLIEAANLLKQGDRPRDRSRWMSLSDSLAKTASRCYGAAQKKDAEALLACGETLNNSCDNCHLEYDIVIP